MASASFGPPDAVESFARLAATLPGPVGIAISPVGAGPLLTFGPLQAGHAWSTMKVPVLVTELRLLSAQGEVLTEDTGAEARAALVASDNAAAQAIFARLERRAGGLAPASESLQETLRVAGDRSTRINTAPNDAGFTTWGQTEWSASGQVAFYRSLARGRLLPGSETHYVLELMRSVQPDQRWGAGSAPFGVPVAFKGGWGPEDEGAHLVRQAAIVGSGDAGYVFGMLALASDFSAGTRVLDAIAAWVARSFP